VIANWDAVFQAAAQRGVAIELDGDPARQDLDYTLGRQALAFGCIFSLDSDAQPRDSCPMPRPPWRTRGWPQFPPTESSTAGHSSGSWYGWQIPHRPLDERDAANTSQRPVAVARACGDDLARSVDGR